MIKVKGILSVVLFFVALAMKAQTGTLPIVYIDTEEHKEITSKTVYLPGTYYIVDTDYTKNVGSEELPLSLEIRGRGHSSWRGTKKPYKIKLDKKAALLGMKTNKHWALLKFNDVTMPGFQLGRLMGMDWTATSKPVELVLNGVYNGLYLLTETNRIGKNRLDIYEQKNGNEDKNSIPYGWLVEIDNYKENNQIKIKENSKWNISITYHSPDSLSSAQNKWLVNEFTNINAAIYYEDKLNSTWEEMIDVDAMARFFIIQEVLDNSDGFHGSFYMHKDSTEDARWVAGPLWDLSCGHRAKTDYTFRMKTSYAFIPHWIGELIIDEDFCRAVREAWSDFYDKKVDSLMNYIDECLLPCYEAYEKDKRKWNYTDQSDISKRAEKLKTDLLANIEWFNDHLPSTIADAVDDIDFADSRVVKVEYINVSGMRNSKPWPGLNVKETTYSDGRTSTTKVIIKDR